ncbi:hypothetical protein DB347_21315 [Opitutaceae bacterium EW11]|nr:hypothetical protein DB347_21315 [Opitutaceae bacterium EW11]
MPGRFGIVPARPSTDHSAAPARRVSASRVYPSFPMNTRVLCCLLAGCLFFALGAAPCRAATKVTENDYQKYVKLEYAQALFNARKTWSRQNPDLLVVANAELAKAWKDSGWSKEEYGQVEEVLGEVSSSIRSAKDGEISEEDLKAALGECDSATVATVRTHYDDLNNRNSSAAAEKQVREELQRERAGVPPSESEIRGTWVFDCDATIDWMMPGMKGPEVEKLKNEMTAKVGTPVYIFGPGASVEVRSKGTDGAEKVEKATYRIEGDKIYFRSPDGRREDHLQIGMRKGKLQMGLSFGMSVFSRK